MKPITRWMLVLLVALALTGCADHLSFAQAMTHESVGFWRGYWHGAILPFAWLVSLFDKDVAIYAIYNNGGWYDFGYLLGVSSLLAGVEVAK